MRICLILVAGLDGHLLANGGQCDVLASFPHRGVVKPVTPAVTSSMQATLSTGSSPAEHGIIANGLFTHDRAELHPHLDLTSFPEFRRQISFWEQANSLLQRPRFWQKLRTEGKKVAMLFWQNSMPGTGEPPADIIITPKPEHSADGKTFTACWTEPRELYAELTAALGPFPLQHYWGPFANIQSSRWIIEAAKKTWKTGVDLQLVYLPHMDYNLQRLGPDHPAIAEDLQALDVLIGELVDVVRAGGGVPVVCGDYGIVPVSRCVMPNLILRNAGLLKTVADADGKLLIDYDNSRAAAMVDHQIAHVYCPNAADVDAVAGVLRGVAGVARIATTPSEKSALGLDSPRSGSLILLAQTDTWFAHDWWQSDAEKPQWQFSVDIHRKPGYDPRELFADPVKRVIAQDATLVNGSHGVVDEDTQRWPVILSDRALPDRMEATDVATWLKALFSPGPRAG